VHGSEDDLEKRKSAGQRTTVLTTRQQYWYSTLNCPGIATVRAATQAAVAFSVVPLSNCILRHKFFPDKAQRFNHRAIDIWRIFEIDD
jgi:hypothetical protein